MSRLVSDTLIIAERYLVRLPRAPDLLRPEHRVRGLRDRPRTVVDAMRALWVGTPAGNDVWGAFVWCFIILAVFAPLAVARYRTAAGRS